MTPNQLPEREFFWGVFTTLYYDDALKLLKEIENKKKREQSLGQKGTCVIKSEVYQALMESNHQCSKCPFTP